MSFLNQDPYGRGGYPQQQGMRPMMPQQTGFLAPQATGYPGAQFQQPQPTGMYGQPQQQQQFMRPQATGYPMQQPQQQMMRPQPTGMMPMGLSPASTGLLAQQGRQQPLVGGGGALGGSGFLQNQFMSTFMPSQAYLQPQPTGYPGMQQQMPSQVGFAASGGPSLQQTFQQQAPAAQQLSQVPSSQAAQLVSWQLNKDEKRQYDQIFRAWDKSGTGFIGGDAAKEIFGQSGLEAKDLMAIWNLADVENRGRLNIDEFHVAMGLIYRRLQNVPIPDTLPAEMAPPSSRDLADSVTFVNSLLKNDLHTGRATRDDAGSRAKARSLHDVGPQKGRKDATVYRFDESEEAGGKTYKSSSRHLDRSAVRFSGDDEEDDGLGDVKRRLKSTQNMLDASRVRDEDEDETKEELRDLTRRIERIQDDLSYNLKSGRRTTAKDEERRRLERELMRLEHEELPVLERKMEEIAREKRRERANYTRDRDDRNERTSKGRFADESRKERERDDYYREKDRRRYNDDGSSGDEDQREDVGYNRGTFDRHAAPSRGSSKYSSARSSPPPPAARSTRDAPPPAAPAPPPPAPVAAPAPPVSPAPAKKLSPEEAAAQRRALAQQRVQERMRSLGVAAPSSGASTPPPVDTSVQERLERERAEAAQKAAAADKEVEAREAERRAKLERERLKTVEVERSLNDQGAAAVDQVEREVAARAPTAAADIAAAEREQVEKSRAELAAREEALLKEKREREARLAALEKEAQELREAEENFVKNKAKFAAAPSPAKPAPRPPPSRPKPTPPASKVRPPPQPSSIAAPPPPPAAPTAPVAPPAPLAPPAPSPAAAALSPSATSAGSKNPFHRLGGAGAATPSPVAAASPEGTNNPFFKMGGATARAPPAPEAPPAPAAPVAPKAPVANKKAAPADDDWDLPKEKDDEDDSSDDEDNVLSSRKGRSNLASALFSGIMGAPARPSSAQANTPTRSNSGSPAIPSAPTMAPPAPPAPPAAPALPSAPAAPAAPPAPALGGGGDAPAGRPSALLGQIQMGMKLKKAVTKDKSGPAVTGAVIGDPSPPVQVYVPPPSPPTPPPEPAVVERAPSPPPAPPAPDTNGVDKAANRQSVDWYGSMASTGMPSPNANGGAFALPSTAEEPEEEVAPAEEDPLAPFDLTTTIRSRTVYAYDGQQEQDLSFAEDTVILANPAKDADSPWWYGTVESTGRKGWFPSSYAEPITVQHATALYAYTAASDAEFDLEEGSLVDIVDASDANWFKAEKDGRIALVPATYISLNSLKAAAPPAAIPVEHSPVQPIPAIVRQDVAQQESAPVRVGEDIQMEESDEEDDSDVEGDTEASRARETERLRILEAAGLIVRHSENDEGLARRPTRRRRPAPARPARRIPAALDVDAHDDLDRAETPPPEYEPPELAHVEEDERHQEEEGTQEERTEDAYDRYQRLMQELPELPIAAAASSQLSAPPLSPEGLRTSTPSPAPGNRDSRHGASAFFSRVKTGISRQSISGPTERPRPIISTPMTATGSEDNRASIATIGSSWASLIDASALENLPDRERKRQEAIFEFIVTEQSYLSSLQLLIEVFYSALQPPVLPTKASAVIFANVEDILLFNTSFGSALEARQRESRLYVNQIGDIIKDFVPGMDVYRPYCVNQSNAARTLADLKADDPVLRVKLETLRVKGLELEHFLLEPMQRITRYPLLISQIARYTDEDNADHGHLAEALAVAESILVSINEAVRGHENQEKLAELSDSLRFNEANVRLDLTARTRFLGPREILKEGSLVKAKSGRKLTVFLFNDMIIFTEVGAGHEQVVYRWPMPLEEISVREKRGDDLGFSVVHRGETIAVRASGGRAAANWVHTISAARERCLQAVQSRRASRAF